MTELIHFDAARRALEQATTIDEVADIRDKAEAMRVYCRQQRESFAMQQKCAEIKLRAERRLGEILREMPRQERGRPEKKCNTMLHFPRLDEIGIDRMQAHRWQSLTDIPEDEWEAFIEEAKAREEELTSAAAQRLAKQLRTHERKSRIFDVEPETCVTADLERLVADGRKFGTIYLDPPWQYDNQATRGSTDNHYQTMTPDELAKLPVGALAGTPSHIHMWTTNGFLEPSLALLKHWGFTFKSTFVWIKPQMGMGNYWRNAHEFLLLGVKGSLTFPVHNEISWLKTERKTHSAKPERIREILERTSPPPRIELFARQTCPGWVSWGNEIERTLFNKELLDNAS